MLDNSAATDSVSGQRSSTSSALTETTVSSAAGQSVNSPRRQLVSELKSLFSSTAHPVDRPQVSSADPRSTPSAASANVQSTVYTVQYTLTHSLLPPLLHSVKGAITSEIKHAIKHAIKLKTSPARLAQLLQPSLAFCFSLQPMTAHWTVRLSRTSDLIS